MPSKAVISVIDDDEAVRVAIQSLLRSLDYDAHIFASAEEFLASRQLRHSSCVISDVQMPGLSGVQLQELLRAKGIHIPVIFITAHSDERVRERAMRAGAVAFVDKPISQQNLVRWLDEIVKAA
jgi:FixJ family two-component response regulator